MEKWIKLKVGFPIGIPLREAVIELYGTARNCEEFTGLAIARKKKSTCNGNPN